MIKITDNELELLRICWQKKEFTARDIFEESLNTKDRKYETIKTTLERMEKKGVLKRRKIGPVWLYETNVDKKEFTQKMVNKFVTNVFNGNLLPFFVNMIDSKIMSREEIEILKKTIEKIEGE